MMEEIDYSDDSDVSDSEVVEDGLGNEVGVGDSLDNEVETDETEPQAKKKRRGRGVIIDEQARRQHESRKTLQGKRVVNFLCL